ncbi:MAG TPA: SDR family oxidoreductase [Pseudonocardia sp.]|nr:SDR family oxidoreductase [Pseudonocardia sp.]
MTLDFRLDGRTALVTGASRGLGAAIADGLASLGARVYGTSRERASAEEIARRYGTEPVVLDVADVATTVREIERLQEAGAGIDLLVNNAGGNAPGPALEVTPQDWDMIHDANLRGLFFASQAMARGWVERKVRGVIVNIGSQAGMVAIEGRSAYGSSKGAVEQLTRNLALEWAAHGVRVNSVAPTFVRTELTAATLAPGPQADELLSRIPLGRFGDPDDVVGAVAFLLGDAAALVTGHTLVVDGGYTIH